MAGASCANSKATNSPRPTLSRARSTSMPQRRLRRGPGPPMLDDLAIRLRQNIGFVTIGTLAGFINGCVVVYGRIQPIIATLATGAVYIGIALFLRPTPGGKIDEDLNWALTNSFGDFAATVHIFDDGAAGWFAPFAWIPVPFVLLVLIALLVWVPFRRSVVGRAVYAVGSAEGAAYMSGLPTDRAKTAAFTLGGFCAGCGGLSIAT